MIFTRAKLSFGLPETITVAEMTKQLKMGNAIMNSVLRGFMRLACENWYLRAQMEEKPLRDVITSKDIQRAKIFLTKFIPPGVQVLEASSLPVKTRPLHAGENQQNNTGKSSPRG